MAKKGLGKGLNSLFNEEDIEEVTSEITKSSEGDIKKVRMSLIEPNKKQPRRHFDEEKITALADSIKEHGLIQPIIITPSDNNMYKIVAGERRWRAAKLAGLKEVPVVVRELSTQEIVEISLIENIQREDLNPVEEAMAYKRLIDEFHLKQDEIAERVSKSRTAVTNSMRLLKLSKQVQQMVIDEMISTGHARCLISIEDQELQHQLALRIFDEKLSVRETEKLVRKLLQGDDTSKKKEKDPVLSAIYADLADQMKRIFGTKVEIHQKNDQKGKIEIEYYSQDELNRLVELIQSIQ